MPAKIRALYVATLSDARGAVALCERGVGLPPPRLRRAAVQWMLRRRQRARRYADNAARAFARSRQDAAAHASAAPLCAILLLQPL